MLYDPGKHHRRSIRLKGYDYSQAGAYFVTICTQDRDALFGEIVEGTRHPEVVLNEYGSAVAECWTWLADQYPYVELDKWIVMPNHLHGIIVLSLPNRRGDSRIAPTRRWLPLSKRWDVLSVPLRQFPPNASTNCVVCQACRSVSEITTNMLFEMKRT